MKERDQSRRGYDRLARHYCWLEQVLFRDQLQNARVALLDQLPRVGAALILGDGDGRLLRQLSLAQPECQIVSVDQSGRMLQLQRQRMAGLSSEHKVEFIHDDAINLRPNQQYDLLVTAFFLDCFTDQDLLDSMPRWLHAVRPGGYFYFVDFCRPLSGWRRLRADCYLGLMHWWFRWLTGLPNRRLVDLDHAIDRQPLSLIAEESLSHGLISARLYRVGDCDDT